VEQYHINVAGRVGDVLGNVTVVQSYARLTAEVQAMRAVMGELLAAQYPVLTWWGLVTVLTRAAATITVVIILSVARSWSRATRPRPATSSPSSGWPTS
jgi:ATP-binding cassette subfamily B protein